MCKPSFAFSHHTPIKGFIAQFRGGNKVMCRRASEKSSIWKHTYAHTHTSWQEHTVDVRFRGPFDLVRWCTPFTHKFPKSGRRSEKRSETLTRWVTEKWLQSGCCVAQGVKQAAHVWRLSSCCSGWEVSCLSPLKIKSTTATKKERLQSLTWGLASF